MKYPCNLIKDLLPLYVDNVCSDESREIVKIHLSECDDCSSYYDSLSETNTYMPFDQEMERQKAKSFLNIKKKLRIKQVLVSLISVAILTTILVLTVVLLSNYKKVVIYDDNISVSMVDGNLIERLKGSVHEQVNIKRVETEKDGKNCVYLFFCIYDTKWNEIITNNSIYTECVLCYEDGGANEIDAVYYYIEDDTGIENMNYDELQGIINKSTLLWNK